MWAAVVGDPHEFRLVDGLGFSIEEWLLAVAHGVPFPGESACQLRLPLLALWGVARGLREFLTLVPVEVCQPVAWFIAREDSQDGQLLACSSTANLRDSLPMDRKKNS